MAEKRNIFLIGPMGAGKSTIGRELAERLHLEFFDSDQEIERRTGADIAWVFDLEGEEGFRKREEGVIASNGALQVTTGTRTGRSPEDKFIVKDSETENNVDWGPVNHPFEKDKFDALWERVESSLEGKDKFVMRLLEGMWVWRVLCRAGGVPTGGVRSDYVEEMCRRVPPDGQWENFHCAVLSCATKAPR